LWGPYGPTKSRALVQSIRAVTRENSRFSADLSLLPDTGLTDEFYKRLEKNVPQGLKAG
jgi:hypothetical protein